MTNTPKRKPGRPRKRPEDKAPRTSGPKLTVAERKARGERVIPVTYSLSLRADGDALATRAAALGITPAEYLRRAARYCLANGCV